MQLLIGLLIIFNAEPQLFTQTTLGLGSICEIKIYEENETKAFDALNDGLEEIALVDSLFSIYSPKSEISKLNESKKIKASKSLLEIVLRALEISKLTNGAFDITIYPLLEFWGFYKGEKPKALPGPDVLSKLVKKVDYRRIRISSDTIFLDKDMKIDLGGIAQGFAADQVAKRLKAAKIKSALINIGGEVVAIGQKPGDEPWEVGIRDPRSKGVIEVLKLKDRAVSTSGDYEKFFEIKGKRYSHIIDPRTGMPARGCISVTITAKDATTADALATAVFVLGPDQGKALIDSLRCTKGLIYVEKDGKPSSIFSTDWPHD